jgi:hypothetical protein
MKKMAILFFIFFPAFLAAFSQENVFPEDEWLVSTPEAQGIDAQKISLALEYLASQSKHNKNKEVLIIRNGYQIYGGENIDSTHNIKWSCSKTFTINLATAILFFRHFCWYLMNGWCIDAQNRET